MVLKRVGVDLTKNMFQVHRVDGAERPVLRNTLQRNQMLISFAQHPPMLKGTWYCQKSCVLRSG